MTTTWPESCLRNRDLRSILFANRSLPSQKSAVLDFSPINVHFHIPPMDHLGRDRVEGHVRFHAGHIDLYWRKAGNVFTNGSGDYNHVELPYPRVVHVNLVKKWFKPPVLNLHLDDPSLVAAIPGVASGKLNLTIDSESRLDAKKLEDLIDFRSSQFLLDETNERLARMKAS